MTEYLKKHYLEPAKSLIESNHLLAAGLILLCIIESLSKIEPDGKNSKSRFINSWKTLFPEPEKKIDDYEFRPSDKNYDDAVSILYSIFRCAPAHNGGDITFQIKNKCKEYLGDWEKKYNEFEIINDQSVRHAFYLETKPDSQNKIELKLNLAHVVSEVEKKLSSTIVTISTSVTQNISTSTSSPTSSDGTNLGLQKY